MFEAIYIVVPIQNDKIIYIWIDTSACQSICALYEKLYTRVYNTVIFYILFTFY